MGAEESKESPRALSRWVVLSRRQCRGAWAQRWHTATLWLVLTVPSRVGLLEQGEQTGGRGVAGGCILHQLFHLGCAFSPLSA